MGGLALLSVHGSVSSSSRRRCAAPASSEPRSGVAKRQVPLPGTAWQLSGHDLHSTERVQLLVGLPYGSWSYPKSFAYCLDVLCDRRIGTSSVLPRETFCLSVEQVDGHC